MCTLSYDIETTLHGMSYITFDSVFEEFRFGLGLCVQIWPILTHGKAIDPMMCKNTIQNTLCSVMISAFIRKQSATVFGYEWRWWI